MVLLLLPGDWWWDIRAGSVVLINGFWSSLFLCFDRDITEFLNIAKEL